MTPSESKYLGEMILEVKSLLNSKQGERDYLIKHEAIDEDGSVLANYPMLTVYKSGGKEVYDGGGLMPNLLGKQSELEKAGISSSIEMYPHFWSYFIMAKSMVMEEIKKRSSKCKLPDCFGGIDEKNKVWCECVKEYVR